MLLRKLKSGPPEPRQRWCGPGLQHTRESLNLQGRVCAIMNDDSKSAQAAVDPFFVLSERHPTCSDALSHPCLVDVVHRVRGRPRFAPRPMAGGIRTRPSALGLTLAKTVWVQAGDVHFSHDYCHPSILLPIALQ